MDNQYILLLFPNGIPNEGTAASVAADLYIPSYFSGESS